MQNIQDLKDRIFFESKNILSILGKTNNVDDLLSKQNLIDELTERVSFLQQLENKIHYYQHEATPLSGVLEDESSPSVTQHFSVNVTEEEALFNNALNEIENKNQFSNDVMEEEAIFNNQLNEIVENEFHENIVTLAEEHSEIPETDSDQNGESENFENENSDFDLQMSEIDEEETSKQQDRVLSFIDEERVLENAEPEDDEMVSEEIFGDQVTEEEAIFNNQLNEIDDVNGTDSENEEIEKKDSDQKQDHSIDMDASGFEDEMLIEESENEYISTDFTHDEIATENSNVDHILADIKKTGDEFSEEKTQDSDRRKIVEIDKPLPETGKDIPPSDESFENLDTYNQEKKIKLANIKGLKTIQTLFDDDPLDREIPKQKTESTIKEDTGSLLKTNIPTGYMEAEKQKQEFRLDLNDRMAFTKMLFNGSQTDLNQAVSELNRCRNLEEAKEYLSDLYYDRKWNKVDEYAQRLWVLVENKFL
ncbi:hypothetical protein N0B16_08705 [Chryseobacterium sp. GMJ5]|uniref:Uncharacterized protein n=1 Tax=Chryseobacterium gilvum TaxID=2976534 RepID=A0ABT2VX03_9FLAO|nr:hypothetical protein [Chryseobacterium gilvum]MCU7614517.1 hypothetical protein [Chryseobacterium gilvum]